MPNLIYQNEGTAITWLASGGTNVLTLTSLGAGAGRQGALHDFGTAARSYLFAWRAWYVPATTAVVNERVEIRGKTSDGTHPDNDDGTGDAAVSSVNKLLNLEFLGNIIVDEAATVETVASGLVYLPQRYFAPVFWNFTADAFSATAGDHGFSLTPVPLEVQ